MAVTLGILGNLTHIRWLLFRKQGGVLLLFRMTLLGRERATERMASSQIKKNKDI